MVIFSWLGLGGGIIVHSLFRLHWALTTVLLVWAGWRAGLVIARRTAGIAATEGNPLGDHVPAGWQGGLLAAALCALTPILLYFSPHVLTEIPSMLLFVWGFVLTLESYERGNKQAWRTMMLAGFLLSFGACLRISNAPLALLVPLDLLLRRRLRLVLAVGLGALGPIVLFGAVDAFTWGRWFHSFIRYVTYNFIEGRAIEHGVVERTWYMSQLYERAGVLLLVPLFAALYAFPHVWIWVVGSVGLVAYLSTQAHQEERFMLLAWPLLLIAAGGGAGGFLAKTADRAGNQVRFGAIALAFFSFAARNLAGVDRIPDYDYTGRFPVYESQSWVGQQADATGLMVEGRFHLSGGYVCLGRNIVLVALNYQQLSNRVFNYVVVQADSPSLAIAQKYGFRPVHRLGNTVVAKR
jgi:hypothetical protein